MTCPDLGRGATRGHAQRISAQRGRGHVREPSRENMMGSLIGPKGFDFDLQNNRNSLTKRRGWSPDTPASPSPEFLPSPGGLRISSRLNQKRLCDLHWPMKRGSRDTCPFQAEALRASTQETLPLYVTSNVPGSSLNSTVKSPRNRAPDTE